MTVCRASQTHLVEAKDSEVVPKPIFLPLQEVDYLSSNATSTYGDSNYNLTIDRALRWIPDPAPTSSAIFCYYYFSDMTVAETMGLTRVVRRSPAVTTGPL